MILARQAQLEFLLLYTQLNPRPPDSVQTKSFISLLPGEKKKTKQIIESHVNQ